MAELMEPRFKNFAKKPQIPGQLDPKLYVQKIFDLIEAEEEEDKRVDALVHLGMAVTTEEKINTPLKTLIVEAKERAWKSEAGESDEEYLRMLDSIRQYLLANPDSINERWEFEVTPLHDVACSGFLELTELLLSLGANTSLVNSLGETAEQRCRGLEKMSQGPEVERLLAVADLIVKH